MYADSIYMYMYVQTPTRVDLFLVNKYVYKHDSLILGQEYENSLLFDPTYCVQMGFHTLLCPPSAACKAEVLDFQLR